MGIWTIQLDFQPMSLALEAVAELEELGYGAVWVPETAGREPFASCATLLSATSQIVVATGIASTFARTAMTMASGWKTLSEAFPGRFLLGIGVSHQMSVEFLHRASYAKPYSAMVDYLDVMDQAPYMSPPPSPEPQRVLAALGPKMLRLAGERALGAHPYLVPVEHTAMAREILGAHALLAPEIMAVLDTDPDSARATARRTLTPYLGLVNYSQNLRRLGWGDDDLAGGGSDRLVDALVAWGSPDDIAARVAAHHEAGADHVCVQVLPAEQRDLPLAAWRQLADVLCG